MRIKTITRSIISMTLLLFIGGCSPRPLFWNTLYKGDHEDYYNSKIIVAAIEGDTKTVINCLKSMKHPDDSRGEWGSTALSRAVMSKRYDVIRILVEAGADPNLKVYSGTPLSIAIWNGDITAFELMKSGNIFQINEGWSLLHCLCASNNLDEDNAKKIATILLDAGLDPNVKYPDGETILNNLVDRKQYQLIRLILERGGNPCAIGTKNMTAVDHAKANLAFYKHTLERELRSLENDKPVGKEKIRSIEFIDLTKWNVERAEDILKLVSSGPHA